MRAISSRLTSGTCIFSWCAQKALRDAQRLAFGQRGIVVGDDEAVGLQRRHIGERIADEHARGESAGPLLGRLRHADALAEQAGRRDQFIAAHQRRDRHLRGDRLHLARDDPQQQSRGALAGLEEVDVRIGVIGDDRVAVLEHAVGEDAVQIERDDDGDLLAEDLARLRQQVALGIELLLAGHRAVHAEVDAVHRRRGADAVEKLVRDALATPPAPACRRR